MQCHIFFIANGLGTDCLPGMVHSSRYITTLNCEYLNSPPQKFTKQQPKFFFETQDPGTTQLRRLIQPQLHQMLLHMAFLEALYHVFPPCGACPQYVKIPFDRHVANTLAASFDFLKTRISSFRTVLNYVFDHFGFTLKANIQDCNYFYSCSQCKTCPEIVKNIKSMQSLLICGSNIDTFLNKKVFKMHNLVCYLLEN